MMTVTGKTTHLNTRTYTSLTNDSNVHGDLFDRPSHVVEWKWLPRGSKSLHASDALKLVQKQQQQPTSGRFYFADCNIAPQGFFRDEKRVPRAHVTLIMESTLGAPHYGDDRCQACIDRDVPCFRYVEGANSQIQRCGASCATCQVFEPRAGCSTVNPRQKRKKEETSDDGDESDSSALEVVGLPACTAVAREVDASATPDDHRPGRMEAATQDASEAFSHFSLSTPDMEAEDLSDQPSQPHAETNSSDQPILRLESLIGELDEDDAQEASTYIDIIRRNIEKGRDTKGPSSLLTRLFAPAKQRVAEEHGSLSESKQRVSEEYKRITEERKRVAEEYRRLSNDMVQVARKKQHFDEVDVEG